MKRKVFYPLLRFAAESLFDFDVVEMLEGLLAISKQRGDEQAGHQIGQRGKNKSQR